METLKFQIPNKGSKRKERKTLLHLSSLGKSQTGTLFGISLLTPAKDIVLQTET